MEKNYIFEKISFPEYESIQNYLDNRGYCYTTRVYKEVRKYIVGQSYIAPWGDVLIIDEVKKFWKVSDRPYYDEMTEDEKMEIRKYSEDIGLPYEFIRFSKRTEAVFGESTYIDFWMQLVRKVRWNFPGLETEELLDEHKQTVLKFMNKKQAICVRNRETVVGVLLFSRNKNVICCLAVDPKHRKRGIASRLLRKALDELDRSKEITVSTFRENDDKGIAPRALYKKFGFQEGEMTEEFGYPNQVFVLRP